MLSTQNSDTQEIRERQEEDDRRQDGFYIVIISNMFSFIYGFNLTIITSIIIIGIVAERRINFVHQVEAVLSLLLR